MLATYQDISNSFGAVQDFLRTQGYLGTDRKFIDCSFSIDHPHTFIDNIEIECRENINNPTFILYSNAFKANGYFRPVWSSYHLFTYDDSTQELKVELNKKNYTITHS
ncbi:hypothetical protein ULMS_29030 [Patiriisocius marinistellae]|uniref:Uncharacterized protein n=1 Tax=Patiriisocius marinistellae TaxID=2494560 RepID=A0A5J4G3J5_9FLAO|nr:hypothetical protein [Patiriisocius marinistellae]GEQ87395.1 hypothetical protein ULMS_29030 [Patiriisocius marinistellae]